MDGRACDRCGARPDADLTRYSITEADDDVREVWLCPECSYGFNTLFAAYVANRQAGPLPK